MPEPVESNDVNGKDRLDLDGLAQRLADYLATSIVPWREPQEMRQAVRETVRLIFTEAIYETAPMMDAARRGLA